MSKVLVGVLWGLLAYLVISIVGIEVNDSLFHSPRTESERGQWLLLLSGWDHYFLLVLPAFIAGHISLKKGVLVGFLVGSIGYIALITIMQSLKFNGAEIEYSNTISLWTSVLMPALQNGFVSSFAGAAGQLLANNKASKNADGRAAA